MLIGIDLGGTKCEIVALHAKNGKEVYRKRIPTKSDDYKGLLKSMKKLVEECEEELGEKGTVGICHPGAICPHTKVLKNSGGIPIINGHPFDKDLSEIMKRPVRTMNDANCFALSEAVDGAGAGEDVVYGVIIGTGCGGGIVINEKPVNGAHAIAGEWGLNRYPCESVEEIEGRLTHEGMQEQGLVETFLAGPYFKRYFNEKYGKNDSTHDIVAAAERGEPEAAEALHQYETWLARGLATIINVLDPDVIVLGGGMSNIQSLYKNVPKIWAETTYVKTAPVHTKLVPARYGDTSGVRGAAWLWKDDIAQGLKFVEAA